MPIAFHATVMYFIYMRFCYYTNLVTGIVLCILELAVLVGSVGPITQAAMKLQRFGTLGF